MELQRRILNGIPVHRSEIVAAYEKLGGDAVLPLVERAGGGLGEVLDPQQRLHSLLPQQSEALDPQQRLYSLLLQQEERLTAKLCALHDQEDRLRELKAGQARSGRLKLSQ
jgi:hypothetical protein